MAYRVSSIDYVPDINGFSFYIFLLGKSWKDGSLDSVEKNFDKLGELLKKGAVIRGYDDEKIRKELTIKMKGAKLGTRDFVDFVSLGHQDGAAFLLTSKHPDAFSAEDDLAIYLPLISIKETYGCFDEFYNDLCLLVNFGDERMLTKMRSMAEDKSKIWRFNELVEIKPGAFGITVNVSSFIQNIICLRREKKNS